MKFLVLFVLTVTVGVALSAPQGDVSVLRFNNNVQDDGGYKYTYELSDGTIHSESGSVKQIGEESPIVVQGAYSFLGPDGQTYWVRYTADENGYHPNVGTGTSGGIKAGEDV